MCETQCDCGPTNPCGEYIFDHRGGVVDGRSFRDWFVYEYMITGETLNHTDPVSGAPAPIGLGWLDDSMTMSGPTEEDGNYIADTGASQQDMADQVAAYQESMAALVRATIANGGYYWQLMDGSGAQLNQGINKTVDGATCRTFLRSVCKPNPSQWNRLQMYTLPGGGQGAGAQCFTDYTAEFMLTRGPYAILGYSWAGCTDGQEAWPRAAEWDEDFGEPTDANCNEIGSSGVFKREWTAATVTWACDAGHGTIARK